MSIKFNMEGGVFSSLNKLCDIIFLSVLWIFLCIPIITIGPATAALYYTTVKVIRKERGYVWHEFWHSFKSNFVSGAIYTVVLAGTIAAIYYGLAITAQSNAMMSQMSHYVYIILVFIVTYCYVFLFPVLSRFFLSRVQTMKMALLLSLKHFPTTFGLIVILIVGGIATTMLWPLLLVTPVVVSLLSSFLIERVFRRYQPKPEEGADKEQLDWYQTL